MPVSELLSDLVKPGGWGGGGGVAVLCIVSYIPCGSPCIGYMYRVGWVVRGSCYCIHTGHDDLVVVVLRNLLSNNFFSSH